MGLFAQFKNKKNLITIILVITIPIWIPILSSLFDSIIYAGRIIGTYIRVNIF